MDFDLEFAYARLRIAMVVDESAERSHEAIHQAANRLHRSIGQQFRRLCERLSVRPNAPLVKFRRFRGAFVHREVVASPEAIVFMRQVMRDAPLTRLLKDHVETLP